MTKYRQYSELRKSLTKGRWVWLFLLAFCASVFAGCSSTPKQPNAITITSLPGDIAYKDTTIALSAVSFCEVYADHGYTGYCVATVDRDNISDDDIYWMLKRDLGDMQAEFGVNAYLSSPNNSLSSDRLSQLKTIYNSEHIYFMFYTEDVQREHLDDFEISLQMIVSPEKDLTATSTQYYYYREKAEEGIDYSDYDSILTQDEINVLVDAINARIDSLS